MWLLADVAGPCVVRFGDVEGVPMSGTGDALVRLSPSARSVVEGRFGSLSAFAAAGGVPLNTVYRWFGSGGAASSKTIASLLSTTGLSFDDLFEVGFSDGYTFTPISAVDSGVSA